MDAKSQSKTACAFKPSISSLSTASCNCCFLCHCLLAHKNCVIAVLGHPPIPSSQYFILILLGFNILWPFASTPQPLPTCIFPWGSKHLCTHLQLYYSALPVLIWQILPHAAKLFYARFRNEARASPHHCSAARDALLQLCPTPCPIQIHFAHCLHMPDFLWFLFTIHHTDWNTQLLAR